MDNLLSGNRPANTSRPAKQDTSIPESAPPSETKQSSQSRYAPQATPSYEEEKGKATFYLAQDVQYDLDTSQIQLRRLAPRYVKKQQLSKSAIVEAALRIACEDLEQKGPNSRLAQILFM